MKWLRLKVRNVWLLTWCVNLKIFNYAIIDKNENWSGKLDLICKLKHAKHSLSSWEFYIFEYFNLLLLIDVKYKNRF